MDAVGGSWAGTLACSECRRKRLTAESFSANQLRKLREGKLDEDKVKCKECVAKAATEERERASQNSKASSNDGEGKGEPLSCSVCKQKSLPRSSFTNTQARKPDASRKCRDCSAAAEAAEAEALRAAREAKMTDAQAASASASALPKGAAGAAARLKAASAECAREAEKVTGLKPLVGAGKRGGRGPGRGRTWRGRASSGPSTRGRAGGRASGGRGET
ncbi:unnamed protein product [Ectocarpus sp. 4 AP-2014]